MTQLRGEDGAAASAKFLAESFRKAGIEVILSEKPKRTSSIIEIMVGLNLTKRSRRNHTDRRGVGSSTRNGSDDFAKARARDERQEYNQSARVSECSGGARVA